MKQYNYIFISLLIVALLPTMLWSAGAKKARIFVVSSYHPEYLWSQDTSKGVVDALLEYGYFDNKDQVNSFLKTDFAETSKMVIQKFWMDTKRKSKMAEKAAAASQAVNAIEAFQPDIILLGDDNAVELIGSEYIDTEIPVVFWGVNGTPVKYGLLDSQEVPGHNVTGVYQAGYLKESLDLLQKIVPTVKTVAAITDDSETGRSKIRELEQMAQSGKLSVKVVEYVHTDDYEKWKESLLRLQKQVDAFIIFNHNTLKDKAGEPVDQMVAGKWYLNNIKIPECSHEAQFVIEGLLCATDDSGYKQGYEAVKIAIRILEKGENPAKISAYAPSRGAFMVNTLRAKQLGIQLNDQMGIEQRINTAKALE